MATKTKTKTAATVNTKLESRSGIRKRLRSTTNLVGKALTDEVHVQYEAQAGLRKATQEIITERLIKSGRPLGLSTYVGYFDISPDNEARIKEIAGARKSIAAKKRLVAKKKKDNQPHKKLEQEIARLQKRIADLRSQ